MFLRKRKTPKLHFDIALRKHARAMYRDFFLKQKLKISLEKKLIVFNISTQNIPCGYKFGKAILTSTRDSNEYPRCLFWIKIRKLGIPLQTPVFLYKSGVKGGIHFTDMFS